MLMANHLNGFGAAASDAAPVTIGYVGNTTSSTNGATHTYTTNAIGTASSDRVVIVAAFARDTGTGHAITGVTCGGVSMTAIIASVANYTGAADGVLAGIYALNVASGTTATIVVSFSAAMFNGAITVFEMTGTGGSVTALDSKSDVALGTTAATNTLSLTTGANGAAIAFVGNVNTGGTVTWTGPTKDYEAAMPTTSARISGAHVNLTSAGTLSVSAAASTNWLQPALVAASWSN